jgi:hypothetical protein
MILKLQEYDFDLHYTPGQDNAVADALSQISVKDNQAHELLVCSAVGTPQECINMEFLFMNCVAAIAGKKTAKKAAAKEHSNKDASRAVKYVSIQQQQPFKILESEMAQMQLEDESLAQCIQTAAKDTAAKNWVMHNAS